MNPVDNSLYRRRMAQRKNGRTGLGDYLSPLYHRVLKTQGGAGQGPEEGPLAYPTVPGEVIGATVEDKLDEIIRLLVALPGALSIEARTKFLIPPREAEYFEATNPYVALAAGATVAVCGFVMPERMCGAIYKIGFAVVPGGSAAGVQWTLTVGGVPHWNFSQLVFEQNTLAVPLNFLMEITQASTIQLVATNTGGAAVNVAGLINGWAEFMAEFKPYGAESASGIG